jgi:anti-sigma factor RsiW
MAGEYGNLSDAELAELAAFADGSLPADRRQAVAERVERSPELSAMVAEQRAALEAVSALNVRAPADLHARVGSREAPASPGSGVSGLALAGGALAVLAAAALLVIVAVRAGARGRRARLPI